jgi:chemotaxis protein MotA
VRLAVGGGVIEEHHKVGQKIFSEMGKYAPAFGMVGTLIGLVQMLADLNDPETLGPSMAVALLTTFYGAVLSNLIFLPMVSKLDRRMKIEVAQVELAIVGMASMIKGDTLQIMQEKLEVFRERGVSNSATVDVDQAALA